MKTQTYVPFSVFWIRPAWSTLEQGKRLQHFLWDRVAKFCVLNRVRVSLSRPNPPPTQIPVEYPPRDQTLMRSHRRFIAALRVHSCLTPPPLPYLPTPPSPRVVWSVLFSLVDSLHGLFLHEASSPMWERVKRELAVVLAHSAGADPAKRKRVHWKQTTHLTKTLHESLHKVGYMSTTGHRR